MTRHETDQEMAAVESSEAFMHNPCPAKRSSVCRSLSHSSPSIWACTSSGTIASDMHHAMKAIVIARRFPTRDDPIRETRSRPSLECCRKHYSYPTPLNSTGLVPRRLVPVQMTSTSRKSNGGHLIRITTESANMFLGPLEGILNIPERQIRGSSLVVKRGTVGQTCETKTVVLGDKDEVGGEIE